MEDVNVNVLMLAFNKITNLHVEVDILPQAMSLEIRNNHIRIYLSERTSRDISNPTSDAHFTASFEK